MENELFNQVKLVMILLGQADKFSDPIFKNLNR